MTRPELEAAAARGRRDEHRISLQPAEGPVQVRIGEVVLAESDRATLLVEPGFPARWYLPREDVRVDLLRRTTTTTLCPFKGRATYWSYEPAGDAGTDVAWSYEDPVSTMSAIRGHVCFYAERTTTVEGGERSAHQGE
jgi:uncharacterized protein (DUF427 family)